MGLGLTTYLKNKFLTDIQGISGSDGDFLVHTGSAWTNESGATARTSLGVGTGDSPTFGGIIIANNGTIGQAAGPLLNFDDTNNYLEITGCKVGISTTTPERTLDVVGDFMVCGSKAVNSNKLGRIYIKHYDIDEEDILCFDLRGLNTLNEIYYGGGSATTNSVQIHKFYTAANNTTLNGIVRTTIDNDGLSVAGDINCSGVVKVDDVQVVGNRVVDARCDDAIDSGDATTDGVIDALRDAMIAHGLIAAS